MSTEAMLRKWLRVEFGRHIVINSLISSGNEGVKGCWVSRKFYCVGLDRTNREIAEGVAGTILGAIRAMVKPQSANAGKSQPVSRREKSVKTK
jgi:hypothetical protein